MKRSYLAIVLTMSIFQINEVFSGNDGALLTPENSTCYHQPYQEVQFRDAYYHNDEPQSYYDNNQNYVTVYVDGAYSVYFMDTNVLAIYYTNGVIQSNYPNGSCAIYDPLSGLSQYYTNTMYPSVVKPGLPEGISHFYPSPCYSDYFYKHDDVDNYNSNNSKKRRRGNNFNKSKKHFNIINDTERSIDSKIQFTELTKPIETENEQKSESTQFDGVKTWANIVAKGVKLSEIETSDEVIDEQFFQPTQSDNVNTWANVVARLSEFNGDPFSLNKKINVSEKRVFNYGNLTDGAKEFLSDIGVKTYAALKQKIRKIKGDDFSDKKNDLLAFIKAANEFRHSNNIENQLLAKAILRTVISNKSVDINLKSRAYTYLGKIKSHDQKYEKAIRTFQEGLSVCGDIGRLYYFMANNYASLGKYNEAIENWNKALSMIDKNDFEIMIKIYIRFLYCQEYHQKNSKKIHELFFKLIDLIKNNDLIIEYKEIYYKLITDFSGYKQTKNCAQIFSFKTPRANGEITDDMIGRLNSMYRIFKDTYSKESSLDALIVENNEG